MTNTITNILVPVDFSPHAEHAFTYATTLAERFGAKLALLYVVDDSFLTGGWSSEIYVPNVPELMENLIADADRRLAILKASAAALGLTVETAVIRGRPAHAIVEHAKNGGFDLIVMGTHGRYRRVPCRHGKCGGASSSEGAVSGLDSTRDRGGRSQRQT